MPEGYEGAGYTYSANALAADGLTPGATVTVGGVSYVWPVEQPGALDSIESAGQVIPLSLPAGATRVGLLGSAIDAGSAGATGTLDVPVCDQTITRDSLLPKFSQNVSIRVNNDMS